MSDLFQIGLSGLRTSQASLATTGHNISNINTKGYSRQTAETISAGAQRSGSYFVGNGSMVQTISRAFNKFAYSENILNTSNYSYAKETYMQSNQMNMLLSDKNTSANASTLNMFTSMNKVSDHPNMLEARTSYLESANNMVNQYNELYTRIDLQYTSINTDISNSADTITTLGQSLAEMNRQITAVFNNDSNKANDLMDQRDQMMNELSEYVQVSSVDAGNGMVNVLIGAGQPLVLALNSNTMRAIPGVPDSSQKELALESNGYQEKIDGAKLGGKVAGLFQTRTEIVDPAFRKLGQTVLGITHSINEQQKQGQTLEGKIGDDIFNDINSANAMKNRVISHNDDLGTADLTVRIDDLALLTPDDYEIKVENYTAASVGPPAVPESIELSVKNLTTGTSQIVGPHDLTENKRLEIEGTGLSLGIDSINGLTAGKKFRIQPTRYAAYDAKVVETNAAKVAAADAEIKTKGADNNTGNAFLRTAAMKNKNDPLYMAKDEPLKIRITGNTGGVITYDILDKNGDPVILPTGSQIPSAVPPAAPIAVGDPMTGLTAKPDPLTGKVTFSFAGVDIEMAKGSPNVADEFTVAFEETGPGDNRNMLIMSSLQSEKIMNGNKGTFQDVYSGMVSVIGSKTANSDISMKSAAVLKTQAFDRVQTVSGVNMDEEAANLLRFQQYYSASARVISIASELFDTILQAGR